VPPRLRSVSVFPVSGGDDWAADAAVSLRQVARSFIFEIFAGDEQPPGMQWWKFDE